MNPIFDKLRHNRRLLWLCLAFILVALFVLSGTYFCPFERFFGIPCPGCGMTRALFALLRLDWRQSLTLNPMLVPTVVFAAVCIFAWARRRRNLLNSRAGLIYGCAMLAAWAIRMALYFPRVEPMVFDHNSVVGLMLRWVFHVG